MLKGHRHHSSAQCLQTKAFCDLKILIHVTFSSWVYILTGLKDLEQQKKSSGTEATHKMMARGRISANYQK